MRQASRTHDILVTANIFASPLRLPSTALRPSVRLTRMLKFTNPMTDHFRGRLEVSGSRTSSSGWS
jgi:hypothetical protein